MYRVNFTQARKWAISMKSLSKAAHCSGVVNEETAEISAILDEEMRNDNASDDEAIFADGGVGAAPQIKNMETNVKGATLGPQLFEPPTTPQANAAMGRGLDPELVELLGGKNKKEADPELQARQKKAAENMRVLNIEPDQAPANGARRCVVCSKLWSFKLEGTIPHQVIGRTKTGTKSNRFCPLADDHDILKNYLLEKKRKRRGYEQARRDKKRAKGEKSP